LHPSQDPLRPGTAKVSPPPKNANPATDQPFSGSDDGDLPVSLL
jgi:hypothetical protein